MESMRDAEGKFLEQLWGDRMHLLTERVQWKSWVRSPNRGFDGGLEISALRY
jgi:hypothetical protein